MECVVGSSSRRRPRRELEPSRLVQLHMRSVGGGGAGRKGRSRCNPCSRRLTTASATWRRMYHRPPQKNRASRPVGAQPRGCSARPRAGSPPSGVRGRGPSSAYGAERALRAPPPRTLEPELARPRRRGRPHQSGDREPAGTPRCSAAKRRHASSSRAAPHGTRRRRTARAVCRPCAASPDSIQLTVCESAARRRDARGDRPPRARRGSTDASGRACSGISGCA
jgi:hypothetical protein